MTVSNSLSFVVLSAGPGTCTITLIENHARHVVDQKESYPFNQFPYKVTLCH